MARWSRPAPAAVGGYDLTFSPVKSISALWAIADLPVAAQIERAHQAAVAAALRFIEDRALFTREGTGGVRQVNVTGLVACSFTHRDSRAGDPDLHTHVAVANKVQTLGGRWLSIDGRILHAAKVAASETYNTALEHHLVASLGVRFAERPGRDRSKRPVREIVGVDPRLNQRWSARRQVIDVRKAELAAAFARDHGRPPGRVEMLNLAQQATLETRDRKHEPRTLAEQRAVWRTEAVETLGGGHEIEEMLRRTLNPPALRPVPTVTAGWRTEIADRVVAALEEHRATWPYWHLWAETQRQLRGCGINPADTADGATAVVEEAINRSIRLTLVEDPAGLPDHLRRTDGASEFTVAGSDQYTSTRILAAEQHLLAAAGRTDGRMLNPVAVDLGLREATAGGTTLDAGQTSMVQTLATDRRQVQLVIAPAGAGKTTALKVLADTWTGGGGDILGLAPSATAAAQLAEATGITADTLHRLTWAIQHGHPLPEWADRIGPKTLLLIDEAGMADTLTLDTAVTHVVQRGGRVCLVGDDQQLGAVGAGGIPADLDAAHGAVRLTQLHRFTDPDEAAATLHIRDGAPDAVDFYTARDRIRIGDPDGLPDRILAAWRHDHDQGLDSLMLAPSRRQVAELNHQARAARLAGQGTDCPRRAGRRKPGQHRRRDHHPSQRPAADRRHIVGPERRPVDRHPCHRGRLPPRHPPPHQEGGDVARRIRPGGGRPRLRHHHPRRSRGHLRHHPQPRRRADDSRAAVHDGQPRPHRQPPLHRHRRRRRAPPHPAYRPSGADRHRHPAAGPQPDQPARVGHHRPRPASAGRRGRP